MIISLVGLGMYALVYVESRHLGALVVLLWSNLLSNIHLHDLPLPKMLLNFVSAIMLLVMAINMAGQEIQPSNLKSFRLLPAQGPKLLWPKTYPAVPPWLAGIR